MNDFFDRLIMFPRKSDFNNFASMFFVIIGFMFLEIIPQPWDYLWAMVFGGYFSMIWHSLRYKEYNVK